MLLLFKQLVQVFLELFPGKLVAELKLPVIRAEFLNGVVRQMNELVV